MWLWITLSNVDYRGIAVLPVISKIIEAIIKVRIQNQVLEIQSRTQRGFTSGASPVNSALPVEECYREVVDNDTDWATMSFIICISSSTMS
jgi:hypothetical protein